MQQTNETAQDYYDRTGQFQPAVNWQDSGFNGTLQPVDAQGRPWVSPDISGPMMFIVDQQHATADHPAGSIVPASDKSVYRDMPQSGLGEFLGNLALVAGPALASYALGGSALAGGAGAAGEGAGAVTGSGVGGGAGGVLGASTAYDPALINAAYSGMGATGVGSTAAGLGTGATGLLASASGFPVASSIAGAASALGGGFTAAQLAQAAASAGGGLGGGAGGLTAGTAATGGTALSRILDGTATTADYLSVAGPLAGTAAGLYGANQQQNAFSDVANQYLGLGAPARARLEASYQPGFSLAQADPAFQNALDTAGQTSARALSTKYGNPADSPAAQAEMQKYLLGNVELPQLNTYRSQLAGQGGLGINTAGTASTAGAANSGGAANAIGYGLGSLLNPQPDLSQLFRQLGTSGQQQNSLTVGGLPYGGSR